MIWIWIEIDTFDINNFFQKELSRDVDQITQKKLILPRI
jgi:hypothetical protein